MENQVFIEKNNNSRKSNGIQNQNEENEIFIGKKSLPTNLKDSQYKFITKKSFNERNKCKKNNSDNFISNEGRWSEEEHEKFLEGIILYGTNWKKIRALVKSRTSIQICSHAQKFFSKMKTCKDEELGLDFTSNSVCNIADMVNQKKSINKNYNIIEVFHRLKTKINNDKNLFYENSNKTKYIKENFNSNDSIKLSTDANYTGILNNLLKTNNQINNLNNTLNLENALEYINKIYLLNYYSNPYIDLFISNYLKSNSNINNLLLPLLNEQNDIINAVNIINSLNNNKSINQINLLENHIYNNEDNNISNNNLILFNNNNNFKNI